MAARPFLGVALVLFIAACAAPPPRRPRCPPPSPCAASPDAPCPVTGEALEDAHALWVRVRTNAEKAAKVAAEDPNKGWLERAIECDGRALFTQLGHCEFDRFPVVRGAIRARLLIVVRPPTAEDRLEAIQAVDRDFGELMKRRAPGRASG